MATNDFLLPTCDELQTSTASHADEDQPPPNQDGDTKMTTQTKYHVGFYCPRFDATTEPESELRSLMEQSLKGELAFDTQAEAHAAANVLGVKLFERYSVGGSVSVYTRHGEARR